MCTDYEIGLTRRKSVLQAQLLQAQLLQAQLQQAQLRPALQVLLLASHELGV
jgi:hypothetical protein